MPFAQRRRNPDAAPLTVDEAREVALRSLAMRPRSRGDLRGRLQAAGATDEVAGQVLDRLTEVGLVDDQAYAAGLARARRAERGLSRRALGGELRRAGLDDEIIADAVEAAAQESDHDVALRLALRRAPSVARFAPEVQQRRLSSFLARRGYGFDVVGPVVAEVVGGREQPGGGPFVAYDGFERALQNEAETGGGH